MLKITFPPFLAVAASFLICSVVGADQSYRVQKGDNLSKIGRLHGVSYQEIMSANRLRNTTIFPGQSLVIPSPRARPVTNSAPPSVATARPVYSQTQASGRVSAPPPPLNRGPNVSPIEPNDPIVQPYASATPVAPSSPRNRRSEEDPLGLGYQPTSPYQNAPAKTAAPHQPYASAKRATSPRRRIASRDVPTFSRSREVPAVAHYPEGPVRVFELDPKKFPTPSFATPQRANASTMKSYTVQQGDSVWSISRKFGVFPLKLRATNNLKLSRIRPGMQLRIP